MSFDGIFNAFSRRPTPPGERKKLTPEFKNRTLMLCVEKHYVSQGTYSNSPPRFWSEIHKKLRFLTGSPSLSDSFSSSHFEDIGSFLSECSDEHFLDFIEFVFQVQDRTPNDAAASAWVNPTDINTFFDVSNLPYYLTKYVWEEERISRGGLKRSLVSLPQIVIRDSEVLHQMAIEPTLDLLSGRRWRTANEEFIKALQHYRKKEWEDCVSMCASSVESVMKIVCKEKGWEKKPDSLQAAPLLKIVVKESNLDPYFVKLLELPHVIRNDKSYAHGAGNLDKTLPQHVAQFVVNMTASTILLIVEEANL